MKTSSIVMCAGLGSRLNSSQNKILHEICGRPIGYWSVSHAKAATTEAPIIVVGHQRSEIEKSLTAHFQDLRFAHQEVPNGTGGAVKAALGQLEGDIHSVLVVCGDAPLFREESLKKLIHMQQMSHAPIVLLTSVAKNPCGYGRIVRNNAQQIVAIVEEKDASTREKEINEVNASVYVFDAEFLRESISNLKASAKGEFLLTDVVANYVKSGAPLGPVQNIEVAYVEMHGVNDRRQLAIAHKELNRRLIEGWMELGATFIDPECTYIEEGVSLAKDTVIYPGVHLKGKTQVGEACVIENGAVIKNCFIERGAHIFPYSVCEDSTIGENASIGPFARLRPDTHLESNVKVGNFVEIKGSRLRHGSKASHLAYVGDADVGEHANLGAGSITCNYDGQNKHKTVIGKNAFIGSNATLIAPLKIGDDAYVAGGSTITESVPEKSIAFGRAHQVNKAKSAK